MTADAQSQSSPTIGGEEGFVHPKTAYRALAVAGTATITALCFLLVNTPLIRTALDRDLSPTSGPSEQSVAGAEPLLALGVLVAVTVAGMAPLCKPKSRRVLETVRATLRSLALVALVLGTIGYVGFAVRLPPKTLALSIGILALSLSLWFVGLQRFLRNRAEGTLIVGTDPSQIEAAMRATTKPVVGYTYTSIHSSDDERANRISTDGGVERSVPELANFDRLSDRAALEDILTRSTVGTVIPALPRADRTEFFGVLEACHRHNVDVETLAEHDRSVLVEDERAGADTRSKLVGIDLQPWSLRNRVGKRLFDLCFAGLGLLCALPVMIVVAAAVKLDSPGPVFYTQERTTQFGDTFRVYKFRSMLPESESATPGQPRDRITRVGWVLRKTHLDELPQLWAIFTGKMSVVGPRAAWTAEERLLEEEVRTWKKRWFVKPGLTGLAQVNDASSETPRTKLRYDLAYIETQSLRLDAKIVTRQVERVLRDALSLLVSGVSKRIGRENGR